MKKTLIPLLCITASPALAHHEIVVATSMVPLVLAVAAAPLAGFTAWFLRRRK